MKNFIALVLIVGFFTPLAFRESDLRVIDNSAKVAYPREVLFKLIVSSGESVEKVYLLFGTNSRSCAVSRARQMVVPTSDAPHNFQWTWDLTKSNNLPPGAEIWWQWEIYTFSGEVFFTDKQTLKVEDPNFDWKVLQKNGISLYWLKGKDSFGQIMLDMAIRSVERLSRKAGVHPEGEIRLMIYPDVETLLNATVNLPGWAGGVAFSEYNSILIAIPAGSTTWASHVIPHEIAHLVTNEQIFNCLGVGIPTWLSEGLAVYAEGSASRHDLKILQQAFKDDEVPHLRDLSQGFYGDRNRINLSYITSGQAVTFLIDEFGAIKMGTLLGLIRSGQDIDEGLMEVYGFDTNGLDIRWRTFQGFPPPQSETSKSTYTPQATMIPTLVYHTPAPSFPIESDVTPVP